MTTITELTGEPTPTPTDNVILGIGGWVAMIISKLAGNHNETLVSDEG